MSGLRLTAFLLILAFLALGPFYRQVLHGTNPVFRNWVMFRGVGYGLVDARFARRLPDGRTLPVDLTVLAPAGSGDTAQGVWRIDGRAAFETLTHRLCEHFGPDVDLRGTAREATGDGWVPLTSGERNLCRAAGHAPADAKAAQ